MAKRKKTHHEMWASKVVREKNWKSGYAYEDGFGCPRGLLDVILDVHMTVGDELVRNMDDQKKDIQALKWKLSNWQKNIGPGSQFDKRVKKLLKAVLEEVVEHDGRR